MDTSLEDQISKLNVSEDVKEGKEEMKEGEEGKDEMKEEEQGKEEEEDMEEEEEEVQDWTQMPEVKILLERENGDNLRTYLETKDYMAFSTCMYMFKNYLIEGFSNSTNEFASQLQHDENLLDNMAEKTAVLICTAAGILPKKDEDLRIYLKAYLDHIGYDDEEGEEDNEKEGETRTQRVMRLWNEQTMNKVEEPELLETGTCLRGLLDLLDDGEGHILPDHMNNLSLYLSHISQQDVDLAEICNYLIAKNIEAPLPAHIQERVGDGTEEEIEEGRQIVDIMSGQMYESGSSIQMDDQCCIC